MMRFIVDAAFISLWIVVTLCYPPPIPKSCKSITTEEDCLLKGCECALCKEAYKGHHCVTYDSLSSSAFKSHNCSSLHEYSECDGVKKRDSSVNWTLCIIGILMFGAIICLITWCITYSLFRGFRAALRKLHKCFCICCYAVKDYESVQSERVNLL